MGTMNYDNNCDNNRSERDRLDPEIFSAIITPHRSLGPRGFLIFMLCLGGLSFIAGVIFVSLGAWPVFGFFGLDVLLVYFAFRANYRSARAYEEVTVTSSELTVRKVSHRGGVRQWTLNPLWVRLERIVACGIRHRATFPGLAWPAADNRRLFEPGRKSKLRARPHQRAR